MKALGAKNAINLDGGGSSTFIIRKIAGFEDGRFAIRNWPYDNGGVEREVANGIIPGEMTHVRRRLFLIL